MECENDNGKVGGLLKFCKFLVEWRCGGSLIILARSDHIQRKKYAHLPSLHNPASHVQTCYHSSQFTKPYFASTRLGKNSSIVIFFISTTAYHHPSHHPTTTTPQSRAAPRNRRLHLPPNLDSCPDQRYGPVRHSGHPFH